MFPVILSVAAVDAMARLHGVTPPCADERRVLRAMTASQSWVPMQVVPESDAPPKRVGTPWHYTTRGGRPIHHPSAYSKCGWSNMVYVASSICIEVGEAWLVNWRLAGGRLRGGRMSRPAIVEWVRDRGGRFLFTWRDGRAYALTDNGHGLTFYVAHTPNEPHSAEAFNRLNWMPETKGHAASQRWHEVSR
jgi:hypothetical protein